MKAEKHTTKPEGLRIHYETNRYQFRFDHDMSKQELEKAADKLKSNYSYITDAYLHYV